MSVPGIGPIISSAMVAAIGTGEASRKAATSPHGLGWYRDKSRPETAQSSAKYRNAAIAICASCSSRRHGSCWSRSKPTQMGALRAQAVDRGRQEATAPQRPRHRARQQARPHRLERPGPWASLRDEQASGCCVIDSRVVEIRLPAEVCERMRRDGGSVFPAHANTGDPNGPVEACPLMRSHAR